MTERPFRFVDSEHAIRELDARLASVGYERREIPEPDASTTIYDCPWRSQPFVLRWHRAWWPDGEHAYDARIEVLDGEIEVGTIEFEALLRVRLDLPLRDAIIDRVVAIASNLSGKRL